MKNNNVLNVRELHNSDIDLRISGKLTNLVSFSNQNCRNLDLLSKSLLRHFDRIGFDTPYYSAVGYRFDDDNCISRIKIFDGYTFFEVFDKVYNSEDFGLHFNILHHDLLGFHYLVF